MSSGRFEITLYDLKGNLLYTEEPVMLRVGDTLYYGPIKTSLYMDGKPAVEFEAELRVKWLPVKNTAALWTDRDLL